MAETVFSKPQALDSVISSKERGKGKIKLGLVACILLQSKFEGDLSHEGKPSQTTAKSKG